MTRLIERILGVGRKEEEESPMSNPTNGDEQRAIGKIIKVSENGWGFISSKDIKFTRVFFHWTSLVQDTLHFTELRKGMRVEFTPSHVEGKGWRAIKIRVLDEEEEEMKS